MTESKKPIRVSKAQSAITPLHDNSRSQSRNAVPAKWNKWKFIPKCKLWECVCLTLDIEPDDNKHGITRWLQTRRGIPFGFPLDFAERLQIAQANVSTNGPIHPQAFYSGVLTNPHGEVLLSELAAFAIRCGWQIPEVMKALAQPYEYLPAPTPQAGPAYNAELDESAHAKTKTNAETGKAGVGTAIVKDWRESAREIADECFDNDTNGNPPTRDGLVRYGGRFRKEVTGGYALRVMIEMQERGIHGPRGLITNAHTVAREALQGKKWWANKEPAPQNWTVG